MYRVLYEQTVANKRTNERTSDEWTTLTFGTLAAEGGTYGALGRTQWLRVVLDEAHNIKNPRSQQACAANALTATRRWAISGTPIQNRLQGLHSLLSFIRLKPLAGFKGL